jgi:2-polyprenyl-3-methyl-5-hydroxy-6-metoxy-1,4-benzoquinol methylase
MGERLNEFDRPEYVDFLLSEWGPPDAPAPYYAGRMTFIVSYIRGDTVLDAGCGLGHLYHEMRRQYDNSKQYLGMDISPAMLKYAKYYCPDVSFIKDDIKIFNVKADSIVCTDVLIHQEDIKPFVDNMWKNATKELIFTMNCSKDITEKRAWDGPITFPEGLTMRKMSKENVLAVLAQLDDVLQVEVFVWDELTSIFRVTRNV